MQIINRIGNDWYIEGQTFVMLAFSDTTIPWPKVIKNDLQLVQGDFRLSPEICSQKSLQGSTGENRA
jgi:hypothetical protein